MTKQRVGFLGVLLLQALLLVAMAGFYALQIHTGTPILLETEPVDPYSPFRGRYVTLRYTINTLSLKTMSTPTDASFNTGDTVYVSLKSSESQWIPEVVTLDKPVNGPGHVVLKGRITRYDAHARTVYVDYGMDTFFLSESGADAVEAKQRSFRIQSIPEPPRNFTVELSEEQKRLYHQGPQWVNASLKTELPHWIEKGWITPNHAQDLLTYYETQWEAIRNVETDFQRQQVAPESQPETRYPMQVKISVSPDGQGYPVALYWQGEQYR